ncbi:GGDEF domain-containing protein [Pseudanabaena sp. Chao 1811]|uniref:GGDEF domain-containing protein n=1 Tax=Pseudanabaena sp. Chao 1811 TaxID=2963092 RepID=UPI0022F3FF9D|nr:GGDEF domain-containing protein [Pseudanabaena sp. Chao 1811]
MFTSLVNLDIQTMIFMTSLDAMLQVSMLVFLCFLVNQYRGIKTYTIGKIFTISSYFITFSKVFPVSATLITAGLFLLMGSCITCIAIAQFTGQKIKFHYFLLFNLLFIGIQSYFVIFQDIFLFKTITQSVFQIAIFALSIYYLRSHSHTSFVGSARFMVSIMAGLILSLIARIIILIQNPPENLYAHTEINSASLLIIFIFTFLMTAGFIMMVCQRLYYDLHQAANTDVLTHLLNRRAMMQKLEKEINHFYRSDRPFAIILIDVDFFKRVNDVYGHDGGDTVLMHLAQILQTKMRHIDSASRWGGEEFLILLPDTTLYKAQEIAERLRSYIEANPTQSNIQITISLGIAVIRQHGNSLESLITAADHALYEAKRTGRNRVVVAQA